MIPNITFLKPEYIAVKKRQDEYLLLLQFVTVYRQGSSKKIGKAPVGLKRSAGEQRIDAICALTDVAGLKMPTSVTISVCINRLRRKPAQDCRESHPKWQDLSVFKYFYAL